MPDSVANSSRTYMQDNNLILQFVEECLLPDKNQCFTLKDAERVMKNRFHVYGISLRCLKNELERALGPCSDQKRVDGVKKRSVFCGYRLVEDDYYDDNHDSLDP